jgi:hypothetical protein
MFGFDCVRRVHYGTDERFGGFGGRSDCYSSALPSFEVLSIPYESRQEQKKSSTHDLLN